VERAARSASHEWCLLVRIGGHLCALPIRHVTETMRPQPVRAVGGAPPFVCGVSVIRGQPVPVVSGAIVCGADTAPRPPARFVSLKVADRLVALAVDEVIGVRLIDRVRLGSLPPLLAAAQEQLISAIGLLDGELLVVLQSAALVSQEVLEAADEAVQP